MSPLFAAVFLSTVAVAFVAHRHSGDAPTIPEDRKPTPRPTPSTLRPGLATVEDRLAADLVFARYLAEGGGALGSAALWKHLGKKTRGWGLQGAAADGTTFVEIGAAPAPLRLDLVGDERVLQLTVRAVGAARRVEVTWDGEPLGEASLVGDAWHRVALPLAAARAHPGSHRLKLRFKRAKGAAPASLAEYKPARSTVALVARYALLTRLHRASPPSPPPSDDGPRISPEMARSKSELWLLPGERASFLLPLPPAAELRVDGMSVAIATKAPPPSVRITAVGPSSTVTLHDGLAVGSVRGDLSSLAGDVVRLSFEVSADAASPVAFHKPRILGRSPRPPAAPRGEPPRHVALVIIDSLPSKYVRHLTPGARPDTPVLDRLAGEGTTFTDFTAAGVYSKSTAATIWTGLYPATHNGHSKKSRLPKGRPLIQQLFRKGGFAALGLSANGYASDPLGYRKGWDRWHHYLIHDTGPFKGEKMYRDAAKWIDERRAKHGDERLLMVLFPTDPHLPYRPPKELAEKYYGRPYEGRLNPNNTGLLAERMKSKGHRLKPDDWDYYQALYFGTVEYADRTLGEFVESLRTRGMLDDTLLVVTADHGEEFLEHGSVGHGHTLYDEIVRIPFLLRHPGSVPAGKIVYTPVEQADLAPTLLDMAGLPVEPSMQGVSLAPLITGLGPVIPRPAFSRFTTIASAARTGRYKLIKFYGRDRKAHLYDLSADPGETTDVADSRPLATRYALNLLAHWEAVQRTVHKASDGIIGGMVPER